MDDIYSRAKEYAFKLLTFRPRTKKEIEDKLAGKNYPAEIIRQIVQMLENYNLVNDEEFAELWIRNRCKVRSYGRWRIKHELALKGIDRALIDEQVNRLISDEEEFEMARRLVEKKRKTGRLNKRKVYAFLRRRGFPKEIVNHLLAEYGWEEAENPCE